MKMKTMIALHDVYCDVAYPEYLHLRNRYYKDPTSLKSFKIIFFCSICLLNLKKCNRTTASRKLILETY